MRRNCAIPPKGVRALKRNEKRGNPFANTMHFGFIDASQLAERIAAPPPNRKSISLRLIKRNRNENASPQASPFAKVRRRMTFKKLPRLLQTKRTKSKIRTSANTTEAASTGKITPVKMRFYRRWYADSSESGCTIAQIETNEPFDELLEGQWNIEKSIQSTGEGECPEVGIRKTLYRPYKNYLASAIEVDYWADDIGRINAALADVGKLERGEITLVFHGNTFSHGLTPTQVVMEHSDCGAVSHWPLWTCPLSNYKAALEGWRTFIQMPDDVASELIIELPEATV